MSVNQVYDATHQGATLDLSGVSKPAVQPVPMPVERPVEAVVGTPVAVPNRCCEPTRTAVTVKGDTLAVASPVIAPAALSPAATREHSVLRVKREEPFRTPAQVMRIYVASWEDESGDLHLGGYLFSEIEARKWNVGVQHRTAHDEYRLLTLTQPPRDAAQDAKTGTSDATAQASRAE